MSESYKKYCRASTVLVSSFVVIMTVHDNRECWIVNKVCNSIMRIFKSDSPCIYCFLPNIITKIIIWDVKRPFVATSALWYTLWKPVSTVAVVASRCLCFSKCCNIAVKHRHLHNSKRSWPTAQNAGGMLFIVEWVMNEYCGVAECCY